jgi:dTMP kinase
MTKLFVIEGLDGAGKSTQIKLLLKYLTENDNECEYLHFPRTDQPWFGELIARFLRGEFGTINNVDPYLVAMLYAGDRKESASVISDWLAGGKIVILDRYTYSNIAYQCAKVENEMKQEELKRWILELEFNHFSIPRPDINIFLDAPFKFIERKLIGGRSGNDRNYLNGQNDIHESNLNFQKKVREIYLRIASTDNRLVIVDCSDGEGRILSPEAIFSRILSILKSRNLI